MSPSKLLVCPTSLLALTLIFSASEALKADPPAGGTGGGIVGVTDKKATAMNTPAVFNLDDETEAIEFVGKGKVKITKNGVTFVGRCREANGWVIFRRTPGGKEERFKRSDPVLIHQDSGNVYYDESTLARRKEFHHRVEMQLASGRSFTISARLTFR